MVRCAVATTAWLLFSTQFAFAEQIHRQTFEGKETSFKLGRFNGEVKLLEHDRSFVQVHSGKQAERMVVRTTSGSFCPVEYKTPLAQVIEELSLGGYVNASRPGATVCARVVLPREVDDKTKMPVSLLLRGDRLDVANRWRRLEVRRLDLLLQQQQQMLQAQLKRAVDTRGAYVDLICFDVHSGVGDLEIYFDDLQFGPIVAPQLGESPAKLPDEAPPLNLRDEEGNPLSTQAPRVRDRGDKNRSRMTGDKLRLGDRPFYLHGIRWTEAPLERIRETGFNTIFVDWPVAAEVVEKAAKLNLLLAPMLPAGEDNRPLLGVGDRQAATDEQVLGYFVGGDLERRSENGVAAAADAIRARARGRPIVGDAVEGLRAYSRRLDMVGAYRYPLMSTLDLPSYQKFLTERKRLVRPGTYMWTWIQTHPPEDYARLVYGHGLGSEFAGPIGPQPEQIRLLAFNAIAAGYRGLVFSSDRAFSTALAGRDRNLQLALLGLELKLIETFVAEGESPVPARTSDPRVAAFSIGHRRASLVVAYWKDPEAQYVVGQSALNELQVIVENAAESAQCLHVGLSEVHTLKRKKDLGGIRITLPEFDTVALIVMTSDAALAAQYQELVHQIAEQAAAWEKELAELTVSKTEKILARLGSSGAPSDNSQPLMSEVRKSLDGCRTAFDQRNYRVAIIQGGRARRTSRYVQKKQWQSAQAGLTSPVADPFALSFYTLPESKQFRASLDQAKWGVNRLKSGDFESDGNLDRLGWSYFCHSSDALEGSALLVGTNPRGGSRCLQLKLASAPGEALPAVIENSLVELVSPAIKAEPGQVVRIRGSVRMSQPAAGVDGAMVWDSLGGETLAMRFKDAGNWRDFVAYRPVNQSQEFRVHLVLTGMGTAEFDNLTVEVSENAMAPLAGQPDKPVLR